jgi:phage terminase small subunit
MAKALTPKQENFCLAYLETGNATEAYRRSYDCARMKEASVGRTAKELLDNPKITSRLEELRKPIREKACLTLEDHLSTLQRLRDKADDAGQFTAAITAETNRGKASGLYVEKTENKNIHSGSVEIVTTIAPELMTMLQSVYDTEKPE